ncbi:MAG: 16S rRNA methyltransferase [Treponema sp.]|jgi:16S rRNA (cytosine1407-C5)-methyltransferase|nr:16S rRNA methyltransferase [Treponema sp.]
MNQSFDDYYLSLYGGRWPSLRRALLEESRSVPFTGSRLVSPYYMDSGSIRAAESLRPAESGIVLDACAAPGGKSLVLASSLFEGATLLSNEVSRERRRRLLNVLDSHLSAEAKALVSVSGFDAAALGGRADQRNRFAGVLLDAPCSSERHVLQNENALSRWTPARPRFLARRQWALLSSCFLLLKPGAPLVYVTCALSPEENDGVAGRLIAKYGDKAALDPPCFPEGEKTAFGRIILPDFSGGAGPMYVARFVKTHGRAD